MMTMITQLLLTISLAVALIAALMGAISTIWRLLAFRILREHREIVLKGAHLLDEKHNLSDEDRFYVAMSIDLLYNQKVKDQIASEALRRAWKGAKTNDAKKLVKNEAVRRVVRAFASIIAIEHPLSLMAMLLADTKTKNKSKLATGGALPFTRAEIQVESSIHVAEEYVKKHAALTCA